MLPNLFNLATSVIPPETINYLAFAGNEISSIGLSVPTYADAVELKASVQAVDNSLYKQLDLDFQKDYMVVYSAQKMNGVIDQVTPDKLEFHNKTWTVVRTLDWNEYNCWGSVLVVANV